ncbi:hypothetical protein KNP414_03220 [Paenibacillus mucilaginosus KNP414]|uniref:Uncharacterized protein n=1 Tax=Paenibacillus mucilaginosus (strain KNP414) TaxID=1036673 RepID=F8FDB8_PAEMK|nr:hypothetical protein KNP414_03220 [Paenibacillus mucilaginosus KNP414]
MSFFRPCLRGLPARVARIPSREKGFAFLRLDQPPIDGGHCGVSGTQTVPSPAAARPAGHGRCFIL